MINEVLSDDGKVLSDGSEVPIVELSKVSVGQVVVHTKHVLKY